MSKNCDCSKCRPKKKGNYAQLSSDILQKARCEPVKVKLNLQDAISGVGHHKSCPTDITIKKSGAYFVVAAPQVGSTNKFCPSYADFWLRLNGDDVPNSNVRFQMVNGASKDVIVLQAIVEVKCGDLLNVMMSGTKGAFIEPIKPCEEPLVPSIIFSIFKIN